MPICFLFLFFFSLYPAGVYWPLGSLQYWISFVPKDLRGRFGLFSLLWPWIMRVLAGASFGLLIELSDGVLVQLVGIRSAL